MLMPTKEWLVRTRGGEILGPFTRRELMEELKRDSFSLDDEIAVSQNRWIPAQNLSNHDSDEFTLTSTRSQTFTRPTGQPPAQPNAHVVDLTGEEDFTPTPDFSGERPPVAAQRRVQPGAPAPAETPITGPQRTWLTASLVAICTIMIVTQLLPKKQAPLPAPSLSQTAPPSAGGESNIVREAYDLIQRGQSQTALKQLTQYHERNPNSGDLEYLIPYASLLITEGESNSRARKFLEQVLASNANLQLKARAYHWLGYSMLSQDDGDMGESHFLEALQINPKDSAARFNLGRSYLKQEKYSQALVYLQLAELEVPDLWLVHIYKGRAKAALGNMQEAQQSFRTAVQSSPDRWLTYIYYALFQLNLRSRDNAQATLRKMLTRDPHFELHSPAPLGFYQEKINYVEYLTAFNHVMEGVGSEERELGKLYLSYLQNGGTGSEAKKIEALAIKGGPTAKLVALKVALDRKTEIGDLRTAVERLPAQLQDLGYYAFVLRGEAKMRLASFSEAQEDIQRAISLEPKAAVAHWAFANLLKRTQRTAEADAEIRSLLGYHPNYIPAIVSSRDF